MRFFWEHEGRLEHTTFNHFCHLPLDSHWNQWSVEYGIISNLTSVLGALKNFCHWVYRWDPSCHSIAITPPETEGIVIIRNTLTAQPWKARVWGWGQMMHVAVEQGRPTWVLPTFQEKTAGRATLSDKLSQLLFLTWRGCLANKGRGKTSFQPKDETLCCTCSVFCFYQTDVSATESHYV